MHYSTIIHSQFNTLLNMIIVNNAFIKKQWRHFLYTIKPELLNSNVIFFGIANEIKFFDFHLSIIVFYDLNFKVICWLYNFMILFIFDQYRSNNCVGFETSLRKTNIVIYVITYLLPIQAYRATDEYYWPVGYYWILNCNYICFLNFKSILIYKKLQYIYDLNCFKWHYKCWI